MTRSFPMPIALVAVSMIGVGCSFEAPGSGATSSNTCSSDEACDPAARCVGSMCVARSIDNSLRIILDVAPLQQADGPGPVSITLPSFEVRNGSSSKEWSLPEPVRVRGSIRNGDKIVVDADVTLTAKQAMAGLPSKVVMASVAGTVAPEISEHDFEVWVADEGEYELRVQPKDTSLPPFAETVQVTRGEPIDVDYAELDVQRTIEFTGETDERPLAVRAFDIATGALISSTAPVIGTQATLRFASEPDAFRLVVRAEGAYDPEGLSNAEGCDHDTPVLPTYSIDSSGLDVVGGKLQVEIPSAPTRVSFAGEVEICNAASLNGAVEPEFLPITLRSTAVMLDAPKGMWTAEVATDTEARREGSSASYTFCVDVFQGEYEVVVTPPESKPCEILAQGLPIQAPDGEEFMGTVLTMVDAAELLGDLTAGMMPLAATTIDVQSLGRAIPLEASERALTAFSRSRQTTTDPSGAFSLPVDRGSYDVTIKPPAGSGYAWYVRRDVTIGKNEEFPDDIDMTSPVAIDCGISYADGETLVGAEITAYAVIVGDGAVERAVAIGKAVADDSGRFMLLLPTEIYEGWGPSVIR